MASFHLAVKAISRSTGRSATAAAAYRAGIEIEDHRTGEVHDYTRKQGVEHCEIIAPADAPAWAADRAALWNAAEQAERRKDAKVAREYEIALPAELSAEARRDLAVGFAREISDRYGVAVDVAIHAPGREGDQRNHHAHLMTTTRRIGPEGLGEKTRELDVKATASPAIDHLRERWADMQNRALALAEVPERVDHRSFARQGIEQDATVHMGPAASAMERRAERQAMREGRDYEPVTQVGQHNAATLEKRGLRQYIGRGAEWLRQAGERVSGKLHDFAASLSGTIERDRRVAAEAERAAREQARLAAERQRQAGIAQREARERARVAEKFREIAEMRKMKAFGYTDGSSTWRATPEALRKAVDAYNGAGKDRQIELVQRIQREPEMARGIGQFINQRDRAIELSQDRGIGR